MLNLMMQYFLGVFVDINAMNFQQNPRFFDVTQAHPILVKKLSNREYVCIPHNDENNRMYLKHVNKQFFCFKFMN